MTPTDTRFVNSIERYRADPTWTNMVAIGKGAATAPFSAAGMSFQRTMTGAATLGGAFFSSLTDPAAIAARRSFIGMDWHKSNIFAPILELVSMWASSANRREATASWLVMESALSGMQQQARYVGTIDSRALSGFVLDRVLSISLLSPYTSSLKRASGMEMYRYVGSQVHKSFGDLSREMQGLAAPGQFYAQGLGRAAAHAAL